jgi:hypothetical protein
MTGKRSELRISQRRNQKEHQKIWRRSLHRKDLLK